MRAVGRVEGVVREERGGQVGQVQEEGGKSERPRQERWNHLMSQIALAH